MLNILLPIALSLSNPQIDTVYNNSNVVEIDGRDIRFGVEETVEEYLIDANLDDDKTYSIEIVTVESPQEVLNIAGTKWLRKDYIVKTAIIVDGEYYYGTGKRKTTVFAMFLDVEGNEVPLNRKAFSKALQSSLKESVNEVAKR